MRIRVVTWNMAGARMLEHLDPSPGHVAASYTVSYSTAWAVSILPHIRVAPHAQNYPDVILL